MSMNFLTTTSGEQRGNTCLQTRQRAMDQASMDTRASNKMDRKQGKVIKIFIPRRYP